MKVPIPTASIYQPSQASIYFFSMRDSFNSHTSSLLEAGRKFFENPNIRSLVGRLSANWKIALPVVALVIAAAASIFYFVSKEIGLRRERTLVGKGEKSEALDSNKRLKSIHGKNEALIAELLLKTTEANGTTWLENKRKDNNEVFQSSVFSLDEKSYALARFNSELSSYGKELMPKSN